MPETNLYIGRVRQRKYGKGRELQDRRDIRSETKWRNKQETQQEFEQMTKPRNKHEEREQTIQEIK